MGMTATAAELPGKTNGHNALRTLIVTFSVSVLVACSAGNFDDLNAYIKSVKARPAERIAPLPEFKTYETFAYSAEDLRDPFKMFENEAEVAKPVTVAKPKGPHPDMNRNKETLEQFPLDTLRFVGQLQRDNQTWAIVTSPDSLVHRVKVGNYIGKNYGRITKITEQKIEISELVPDGMGGWIERKAALSLGE